MAVPAKNLKLDSKRRITLGKLAENDVTSYDAELKDDGTIILHPKVEIPAHEAWLYKNPEALAGVLKGMEDIKAGRVTYMDFSEYADDEIE
ncbi:MAG: hypothetical protein A2Y25_10640 [Candidatus Melainabacteria bacterium GWF2_37_15]|nr:MAG: hypothetical protein A2Y25_10640 [Candidatus Melainabacteria bacterium GWF2_37_15]